MKVFECDSCAKVFKPQKKLNLLPACPGTTFIKFSEITFYLKLSYAWSFVAGIYN